MKNRVDVLNGVNLDQLGRRDTDHYGAATLAELEVRVKKFARELDLEATFWQTNHEGEYCESLHIAAERADGLILNPGAWTHYSWAIREALEVAGIPAVEVHLSAIEEREEWRRTSVIRDLCVGSVQGKGVEGYREAFEMLKAAL
jgi:3-dehydroquinate dehydratase II